MTAGSYTSFFLFNGFVPLQNSLLALACVVGVLVLLVDRLSAPIEDDAGAKFGRVVALLSPGPVIFMTVNLAGGVFGFDPQEPIAVASQVVLVAVGYGALAALMFGKAPVFLVGRRFATSVFVAMLLDPLTVIVGGPFHPSRYRYVLAVGSLLVFLAWMAARPPWGPSSARAVLRRRPLATAYRRPPTALGHSEVVARAVNHLVLWLGALWLTDVFVLADDAVLFLSVTVVVDVFRRSIQTEDVFSEWLLSAWLWLLVFWSAQFGFFWLFLAPRDIGNWWFIGAVSVVLFGRFLNAADAGTTTRRTQLAPGHALFRWFRGAPFGLGYLVAVAPLVVLAVIWRAVVGDWISHSVGASLLIFTMLTILGPILRATRRSNRSTRSLVDQLSRLPSSIWATIATGGVSEEPYDKLVAIQARSMDFEPGVWFAESYEMDMRSRVDVVPPAGNHASRAITIRQQLHEATSVLVRHRLLPIEEADELLDIDWEQQPPERLLRIVKGLEPDSFATALSALSLAAAFPDEAAKVRRIVATEEESVGASAVRGVAIGASKSVERVVLMRALQRSFAHLSPLRWRLYAEPPGARMLRAVRSRTDAEPNPIYDVRHIWESFGKEDKLTAIQRALPWLWVLAWKAHDRDVANRFAVLLASQKVSARWNRTPDVGLSLLESTDPWLERGYEWFVRTARYQLGDDRSGLPSNEKIADRFTTRALESAIGETHAIGLAFYRPERLIAAAHAGPPVALALGIALVGDLDLRIVGLRYLVKLQPLLAADLATEFAALYPEHTAELAEIVTVANPSCAAALIEDRLAAIHRHCLTGPGWRRHGWRDEAMALMSQYQYPAVATAAEARRITVGLVLLTKHAIPEVAQAAKDSLSNRLRTPASDLPALLAPDDKTAALVKPEQRENQRKYARKHATSSRRGVVLLAIGSILATSATLVFAPEYLESFRLPIPEPTIEVSSAPIGESEPWDLDELAARVHARTRSEATADLDDIAVWSRSLWEEVNAAEEALMTDTIQPATPDLVARLESRPQLAAEAFREAWIEWRIRAGIHHVKVAIQASGSGALFDLEIGFASGDAIIVDAGSSNSDCEEADISVFVTFSCRRLVADEAIEVDLLVFVPVWNTEWTSQAITDIHVDRLVVLAEEGLQPLVDLGNAVAAMNCAKTAYVYRDFTATSEVDLSFTVQTAIGAPVQTAIGAPDVTTFQQAISSTEAVLGFPLRPDEGELTSFGGWSIGNC